MSIDRFPRFLLGTAFAVLLSSPSSLASAAVRVCPPEPPAEKAQSAEEAQRKAEAEKKAEAQRSAVERIEAAIGVRFAILESRIRRRIISTRTPYGFKIKKIAPGSAAQRAGLRKGDILLEWGGQPVRRVAQLAGWIEALPAEAEVKIRYARHRRVSILSRRPWQQLDGRIEVVKPSR